MHNAIKSLAGATALVFSLAIGNAQQAARTDNSIVKPTPLAAFAPTAVPALVPYSGFGVGPDGKAITGEASITVLIYKDPTGGAPLFTESQTAVFDSAGRYEVQLGATRSNGIPLDLFGTGEARWLEVQIAGAVPQPRVLLVSVPYALKAGDSTTLGGLPASAYALAGTGTAISSLATANVITPNGVTNVTTTGGTSGYIPAFNGTSSVVNSMLYQASTGVGVGHVPSSAYELDVNGKSIFRGTSVLPNNGSASTSAGTDSFPMSFLASAYNSTSKAAVNPTFYWQAEPTGNNTASPGGTLNLLYNGNFGAGAETGFYLNANGTIHFASGQTFAATGGSFAVDGTSTAGLGVEGNSTSGTGVQGNSSSSYGVEGTSKTGPGVLGYTAGSTAKTAGVVGQAGSLSGFSGIAGVWGDSSANVGVFGTSNQYSGVLGESTTGNGVQGTSTSSDGVYGQTASSSHAGVYGYSSTTSPGVKGGSAQGNGGEFYGGGFGKGVVGVGASTSGYIPGYGGEFQGGNSDGSGDNETDGATGMYATGGSANGTSGGSGVEGDGGYTTSGQSFAGGVFVGGGSNSGYGGDGLVADPGYSSSNGFNDAYAARLNGTVLINGTAYNDVTATRLDHPLDPANKYLTQTSVQSSEMVNIYSGNVTTDEQGLATVQLPRWFEAVNGDLRYQLTMVGHKGQSWVSQEVKDGKFEIASDFANAKVSWQITGVRQDAYAKAHPLVVEEEKNVRERGFYQHPELYGQPATKQTEWGRNPRAMKALQKRQLEAKNQAGTVAGTVAR